MSYGTLVVLLCLGTVLLYVWFFRTKDKEYDQQKHIILDDIKKINSEESKK